MPNDPRIKKVLVIDLYKRQKYLHQHLFWRVDKLKAGPGELPSEGDELWIRIPPDKVYPVSYTHLPLAAFVLAVAALAAVVAAGFLAADAATATDFAQKNLAPSLAHPFGTDWMGRDMLLRTLAGLSTSVLVGLLAAGASSVIALVPVSYTHLSP